MEEFRERADAIVIASAKLGTAAHTDTVASLRSLVQAMNSYYSNRIEGQGTHPLNIERALRRDFSDQPDTAKLQRLALAHIEAEQALESHLRDGAAPLSSDFLQLAHQELYGRLSEADRTSEHGDVIEPGAIRHRNVTVGHHVAPEHEAIPALLARLDEVYALPTRSPSLLLVRAGALHHRAAWVHPFLDGNGRAIRLQTHAALFSISEGLWSVNRGLARNRDRYYAAMADADAPRHGDLDGRGNLSEQRFAAWCEFFLDTAEDQASFMTQLLDLGSMRNRIAALIIFWGQEDPRIKPEAVLPLHHMFLAGPLNRGDFAQMTGLGERTARDLLSRLLKTGLVVPTGGHTAPVRLGFPLSVLQFLLPGLYPEAAVPESAS
ncbi:MAG: Fic family protein [Pseudomonadota bacterium]|nr:Fic family protein [Pseudomonadota bacterium]